MDVAYMVAEKRGIGDTFKKLQSEETLDQNVDSMSSCLGAGVFLSLRLIFQTVLGRHQ